MSSAKAEARAAQPKGRLWPLLVAVAVVLVLIVGGLAIGLSSGQDGADRQQVNPGPADTLKDQPQTDKLGGNTGGGE